MKVVLIKDAGLVEIIKEKGDPYFHRGWAQPESTFLYHVMRELKKQGFDCIKKRMHRDGHLTDDEQQYIRDRKGTWCIFNSRYAICDAGMEFNERGETFLRYTELDSP